MKQLIEYLVSINFGMSLTKVACMDVNTNMLFPLKTKEGGETGIIPTVVKLESSSKDFMLNFFDKPLNIKEIDLNFDAFRIFCLDLFETVLLANDFLQFNKENGKSNFIIAISYPAGWSEKDGLELLGMVQECIPPAIYAIREDVCLRNSFFIQNKDAISDSHLIIDINSYKTSYIFESETKNDFSVRLSLLEESLLENSLFNEYYYTDMIKCSIDDEQYNSAEYYLRKGKYDILKNVTSDIDLTIKNFSILLVNSLSYMGISRNIKKITVISEETLNKASFITDCLERHFPKSVIEICDTFSICYAILSSVHMILNDANRCLDALFSKELSLKSFPSEFDIKIGKIVEKTIQELYNTAGDKYLDEYYVHGEHTSLNHFTRIASDFYKKLLRPEFGFVKNADQNSKIVIDELINYIVEKTIGLKIKCDTSSYFLFSLQAIMFWNKTLDEDIKNVYKRHGYTNYTKERGQTQAYYICFMYIQFNKVSTRIDHFIPYSWLFNDVKNLLLRCFMDFIAVEQVSWAVIPNIKKTTVFSVESIIEAIECVINLIINESMMGLYKFKDGKLSCERSSYFYSLKEFNYHAYLQIKKDNEIVDKKYCFLTKLSKETALYNQIGDNNKYVDIAQMTSMFFNNPKRNKYFYDSNGELSMELTIERLYYKVKLDYCTYWKSSSLEDIYESLHVETNTDNDDWGPPSAWSGLYSG